MREWRALFLVTLYGVYLFVVMEWAFFVTKPSFLSSMTFPAKLIVLALAPLPLLVLAAAGFFVLAIFAWSWSHPLYRKFLLGLANCMPAVILGSLLVLLLDNFTNTVWQFGILRSAGWRMVVYAGVIMAVYVVSYVLSYRLVLATSRSKSRFTWMMAVVFLAASTVTWGWTHFRSDTSHARAGPSRIASQQRPNILLISGDGLNARNLSAYGYERDTTPFLRSLVPTSLFCENNMANCAHTAGSLASVLTGRLPSQTRVIYSPDILRGNDAYRHLPGLLKRLGYRTLHVGIRHYGDAYDLNLRDGFDTSTFQNWRQAQTTSRLSDLLGNTPSYFVEQILGRVRDRLFHVLRASRLPEALVEVQATNDNLRPRYADGLRESAIFRFVDASRKPFLAHVHFMGTHGARFSDTTSRYSKGLTQDADWMIEFYDDAILRFDTYVMKIVQHLEAKGHLQNTLVVIHSDHGFKFDNLERTPMLFLFPRGEHSGRRISNTQNVDIAATILDYMKIDPVDWMSGQSLLRGEPDPFRPIFSFRTRLRAIDWTYGRARVDPLQLSAPLYTIGSATMTICNRSYTLDFEAEEMQVRDVQGHTAICADEDLPAPRVAGAMIRQHLVDCGYAIPLEPRFAGEH